jgi:hypothetical protein
MWEHPFNVKRRKERAAFSQSTKNKLPRNIVNKIFGYKEALNILNDQASPRYNYFTNNKRAKVARWMSDSNVKDMNSSEKVYTIKRHLSRIANHESHMKTYINHLHLVNSKNKLDDLLHFAKIHVLYRTPIRLTGEKFMNLNTPTRRKVLNMINAKPTTTEEYYKIIATIGDREHIITLLLGRLNKNKFRTLGKRKRDLRNLSTQTLRNMLERSANAG